MGIIILIIIAVVGVALGMYFTSRESVEAVKVYDNISHEIE